MPFDYEFVQGLANFGRELAGNIVGQPFHVYRLSATSNGDVVTSGNLVNSDLRAKVTHGRKVDQMENEYIHTNAFEFLMSSDAVRVGDILEQNDTVYGANAYYAVASRRPLKKVVCIRTESLCTIIRPQSNRASGYSGSVAGHELPFMLVNGQFTVGTGAPGEKAAVIPCGIQNIGQMKNQKPERLPMDTITSWWFVYVPALPGLDRIRENDIIVFPGNPNEIPVKYRVNTPYSSPVGTAGQFLVVERMTV